VGLVKLPPVLILRLKHELDATTQIQLDPGLTFASTEDTRLEYSLYGVVVHVSTGSEQGHYIGYIKVGPKPLRHYVREPLQYRCNRRRNTVRGTRWTAAL
jgi:ubiquitin C-terminal hydrolase